jgi:hypothetical protein
MRARPEVGLGETETLPNAAKNAWVLRVLGVQLPGSAGDGQGNAEVDGFEQRRARLAILLDAALGAGHKQARDAKLKVSEASLLARKGDVPAGHVLLGEAEAMLRAVTVPSGFAESWQAAVKRWQDASEAVDAQVSQLQAHLRNEEDPELQRIAELGLNALTAGHKVALMVAIRELAGGASAEAIAEAKVAVDDFLDHLQSEPRIAACDENPFNVSVSIRGTLGPALEEMAATLTL